MSYVITSKATRRYSVTKLETTARTPAQNHAFLQGLIDNNSVVSIGSNYEIDAPLVVPSDRTITLDGTLKMTAGASTTLAQDVIKGDFTLTVDDASVFRVGQWIGVTDDTKTFIYDSYWAWSDEITDITGNVITLAGEAPDGYLTGGTVANTNSVFLIQQVSNVTIQGTGTINGNKANQEQLAPVKWQSKVIEQMQANCGISVFWGCSDITIDGITIIDCMRHGIMTSAPSALTGNTAISLSNITSTDNREKNIGFYYTDGATVTDIVANNAVWEDGIMMYNGCDNFVLTDISVSDNNRYGVAWQQTNSGLVATNITTSGNVQSGIRIAAPDSTWNNCVMTDRLELSGKYPMSNNVMNGVTIDGSTSKYTVIMYGGITGITINDLYMDGNSTPTGAAFYAYTTGDGTPAGIVFDTGAITNHDGTIFDICGTCDVTFINFDS
jgi:hypothetical protein